MRLMTLDASPPRLRPPVVSSSRSFVRASRAASHDRRAHGTSRTPTEAGPGNLVSEIVDKDVPVRPVVAVEAIRVDAVLQVDFRMLTQYAAGICRRPNDPVTVAAAVGKDRHTVFGPWLG